MARVVFASRELPEGLSERQRLSYFQDLYSEKFSKREMYQPPGTPFSIDCTFTMLDGVVLAHSKGTIQRVSRTPQHIATETAEDAYHFLFGVGSTRWSVVQRGIELIATEATPVFTCCSESMKLQKIGEGEIISLRLPRRLLLEFIPNPDDCVMRPFDPASEPLRHLRHYLQILNGPDGAVNDPGMIAHIRTTLLDVVALTLGACCDFTDRVRVRGLRAARLWTIIEHIQNNFSNPSFSIHHVSKRLGVTPRYVQDVLQETGLGFVERVTELRLQKARQMLKKRQSDYLKVGEIGLKCGFNDISYYHQVFRRRFGVAPGQFRRRNLLSELAPEISLK